MKSCPKCSGEMLETKNKGIFIARRNDGLIGETETVKYMCRECGYIEEYAVNPFYLKRRE